MIETVHTPHPDEPRTMTRHADAQGLMLRVFDAATAFPVFQEFESFVRLWRARAAGRSFPSWSDFDIPDFAGWYGRMMVFDVDRADFNPRWRLFSGEFATFVGRDFTGETLAELFHDTRPDVGIAIRDHFRALVESGGIGFSYGPLFPFKDRLLHTRILDLPLSDDGREPNRIVCLFNFVEAPRRFG